MGEIRSIFSNWLFYTGLWWLALMTGVLALARELIQVFRPNKVRARSQFWNWVVIAFIISSCIVWSSEHNKVIDLTEQLNSKRLQVYKDFVEEKTRRINMYNEGCSLYTSLYLAQLDEDNLAYNKDSVLFKETSEGFLKFVDDTNKWNKEMHDEQAHFLRLIVDIESVYANCPKLKELIGKVKELKKIVIIKPEDSGSLQKEDWLKQRFDDNTKFVNEIKQPLDELDEYLQQNLK
ncbi:MAG: hypothetical protein ABSA04_09090 [Desulfobaccales bacterium]|jgi:hypothetical protein